MIVRDTDTAEMVFEFLRDEEAVVVDTETTGLDVWQDARLCGVGLYLPAAGASYYLPFRHEPFANQPLFKTIFPEEINLPPEYLQKLFEALNSVPLLIGHNIKFDLAAMTQDGFKLAPGQTIEDTLSAARLYFHDKFDRMSLDALTRHFIGEETARWKDEFQAYLKKCKITNYAHADLAKIAEYCELDCVNTWKIREKLLEHIRLTDQTEIWEKEREVLKVVWDIERKGMTLDEKYIKESLAYLKEVKEFLGNKINEEAGVPLDPWSNKQLSEVLNSMKIISRSKTAKGSQQWTNDILEGFGHLITDLIVDYREVDKLINTFFEPYSKLGGTVHVDLSPWGAVTGRFTARNPNLQQVSRGKSREIYGYPDFDIQVRRMFIPPEGYSLYCFDYSQMEMVVFSDYINDAALTERLNQGGIDFHSLVAELIWQDVAYRPQAKAISLGLIYGMGIKKLAARINASEKEATEYRDKYFAILPAKRLMNQVIQTVEARGWVKNRFGRRYYLPKDRSYAAMNYLVQGTSADIIKRAMLRCSRLLKNALSRICLQMHDEFVFYIHESEEWLVAELKKAMEATELKTKLFADVSKGMPNWNDKVKFKVETCSSTAEQAAHNR